MNELKGLIDAGWSITVRLSGSKYMILAVHSVTGCEIKSNHKTLTGAIDILYERCGKYHACQTCHKELGKMEPVENE